MADTAHKN